MVLSYPPEMYMPKPMHLTENTKAVWPIKFWIYSRSEDQSFRVSSFEHVMKPIS